MSNDRRVRFGIQTPQEGASYAALAEHWREAERLGYDTVWLERRQLGAPQPGGRRQRDDRDIPKRNQRAVTRACLRDGREFVRLDVSPRGEARAPSTRYVLEAGAPLVWNETLAP
jgi:hypothetical protein